MKKNKPTPFLDLHSYMIEDGEMILTGLCATITNEFPIVFTDYMKVTEDYNYRCRTIFIQLHPTNYDKDKLHNDGYHSTFWGSQSKNPEAFVYTPLRQNIILFCAALNGELDE